MLPYNPTTERLNAEQQAAEVLIPPYRGSHRPRGLLAQLHALRMVQLLSAGADEWQADVPADVLLSTARGAHARPVAEWVLSAILAHARWCPKQHGGGLVEVPVKSRAGKRSFVLPDELYALILRHEEAQLAEREQAANEWHEGGWMFAQPNGKPIDPDGTSPSGSRSSRKPACGTPGCTMPGTQRQRCCSCSA